MEIAGSGESSCRRPRVVENIEVLAVIDGGETPIVGRHVLSRWKSYTLIGKCWPSGTGLNGSAEIDGASFAVQVGHERMDVLRSPPSRVILALGSFREPTRVLKHPFVVGHQRSSISFASEEEHVHVPVDALRGIQHELTAAYFHFDVVEVGDDGQGKPLEVVGGASAGLIQRQGLGGVSHGSGHVDELAGNGQEGTGEFDERILGVEIPLDDALNAVGSGIGRNFLFAISGYGNFHGFYGVLVL